jgi:hypothetical protein
MDHVIWEPFPNGAFAWIARLVLAAIPGAIGAVMCVGAARLGSEPPDWPPVARAVLALGMAAAGLAMLGVFNLILLARRWDYRSPDGRTAGWVQTVLGRVFEAKGTHDHVADAPALPAGRLDSAVLAEP